MSQLDILYRALADYRKNTRENKDCIVKRSAIISADNESDVIEIDRKRCRIETDWIEAIERGITFIEKAINEERQFIRTNGEIIPIEKVKRVSKDSVEHLAKHSNLLTKEPKDGADLIPDNLFTVERLSDFAVYENRFLYMMLCYLRDFISMRYERIVELTNTYNGKMSMNKTVVESHRRVEYRVELIEEKKNDEYLRSHNEAQDELDRILTIYNAVVYFLNTPLMNEVAKAPMLKPPITRTNVLRMNRNFREVMSLYEYISAYDRDGYEVITETKTLSPFVGMLADEMAETVELSSFLTYEYGLGIRDYFRTAYEKEEQDKKAEERRKYEEKIRTVKRHIEDGSIQPEEYIAMLEKRIADLEGVEIELDDARTLIEELRSENKKLNIDLKRARTKIDALIAELERERARHAEEIAMLKKKHAEEIEELHREYAERIDILASDIENDINALIEKHERENDDIYSETQQEIDRLYAENDKRIADIHAQYADSIEGLHDFYGDVISIIHREYAMRIDLLYADFRADIGKLIATNEREKEDLHAEYTSEIDRLREEYETEKEECANEYATEYKKVVDHYVMTVDEMQLRHENEIETLISEYENEIDGLVSEYEEYIDGLNATHKKAMSDLTQQCRDVITDLKTKFTNKIDTLNTDYTNKIDTLTLDLNKLKEESTDAINVRDNIIDTERRKFESEMEQTVEKLDSAQRQVLDLTEKNAVLADLKTLSDGRLNALRSEYGLIKTDEDFTNKQMADELEHQYKVFKQFHKNSWQATKKRIRSEVFAEVMAREASNLKKKKEQQKKADKKKD